MWNWSIFNLFLIKILNNLPYHYGSLPSGFYCPCLAPLWLFLQAFPLQFDTGRMENTDSGWFLAINIAA